MSGIPLEALDFYEALEADNCKEFWSAHRETYERSVKEPVQALCAALEPEFGTARLFRPYRDVRFSKDASPYKTQQGAVVAGPAGSVLYLHVGADGLLVAAGMYAMAPDQVQRFRAGVDEEVSGAELERVVARARQRGLEVGGDTLRTRPRGYPADHPRVELLRHRSLYGSRSIGAPAWLPTPRTVREVAATWRDLEPLTAWLGEHVAASALPARR